MRIITLDDAALEFAESVAYYEKKEQGLGNRFRDEIVTMVEWISEHPQIPRLRSRG